MTSPEPPRLAAIAYERGFDIDRLLAKLCERLARLGIRPGGLLQIAAGRESGCADSIHVLDLRTHFDIWEDRGACARGCRLDERGLAAASRAIETAIADRVDLVVMNRFGRAESLGRGLLASLASAVAAGVPLLTAVRAPYDAAWTRFHGGLGCTLPADLAAVTAWAESAVHRSRASRPVEAPQQTAVSLC